ncbi:ATP-binding protein [Saccharothrix coeruleofusca]|uniref:Kinase n=1 Tax=Saccharothrix coeruleofusca TaxID=33919 RepID=A0A918EGL5_9PSEU|nr:ATP-binding protein [Saccharothrix coeruleofusca]GGP82903.1 hypothetical protein GCM10010185_66210 [Saccharothrix coeruleofusca]
MTRLVILVGLQASGKTTFYTRHLAATHLHVSKDLWPRARHREARQRRAVAEGLAAGRSVAVDNTNASPEERAGLVALGRAAAVPVVGYWFPPDPAGSLRRNAARPGRARVPEVGLFATLKRLRPPTFDEGFDELHEVRFDGAGDFTTTPL